MLSKKNAQHCSKCGRSGHNSRGCKRKSGRKRRGNKKKDNINTVRIEYSSESEDQSSDSGSDTNNDSGSEDNSDSDSASENLHVNVSKANKKK